MNYVDVQVYVVLTLVGLCMGSFLHAVVWRLHAKKDFVRDRSRCDHCHHVLAWYDLLPVLSWLSLGGRCRYCRRTISWHHPVIELVTAALFVASYAWWPMGFVGVGLVLFLLWLAFVVMLMMLAVYDLRWLLLPDAITYPLMVLGAVYGLLRFGVYLHLPPLMVVAQLVGGVACIAGLYWLLHRVSKGKWIGFGDVKLGVFMGLALGASDALVALMAANALGVLVVIPGLLSGRMSRKTKLPFGPFLIAGFFIAGLFGAQLMAWYLSGFGLAEY